MSLLLPGAVAVAVLTRLGSSFSFDALVPPGAAAGPKVLGLAAGSLAFLIAAVWTLLPAGGIGYLVVRAARYGWVPLAITELGSVGIVLVTAWAIEDYLTGDSSTSALIFAVLPVLQAIPLLGTVLMIGLIRPEIFRRP